MVNVLYTTNGVLSSKIEKQSHKSACARAAPAAPRPQNPVRQKVAPVAPARARGARFDLREKIFLEHPPAFRAQNPDAGGCGTTESGRQRINAEAQRDGEDAERKDKG